MEVKVYYEDGEGRVRIESHSMPAYVGVVTNREDREGGRDVTSSESDSVTDVVESLVINEVDGAWLTRTIVHEAYDVRRPAPDAYKDTTSTTCVVPARRIHEVGRIACDGEVVWPAEAVDDRLDALEDAVRALA